MNKKSLNKQELEVLLNKFDNIENINKIKFLGKISQNKSSSGLSNPYFRVISPPDPNIPPFDTARVLIELPNQFRIGLNNSPYVTKLPVFSTDQYATLFKENYTDAMEYLVGIGKIQNYKVIIKDNYNKDFFAFLSQLVINDLKLSSKEVVETGRTLKMIVDKDNPATMSLTTIWTNTVADGTLTAKSMIDNNIIPEVNDVVLQGLVYMPPSLREIKSESKYSVHFKVRIKREKVSENVPLMYQADYDYINVLGFGKQAEEWFKILKQGYPVKVHGRLESSKFKKQRSLTELEKINIAKILNISIDSKYILDIEEFLKNNKIITEYPNYNVWADKVEMLSI